MNRYQQRLGQLKFLQSPNNPPEKTELSRDENFKTLQLAPEKTEKSLNSVNSGRIPGGKKKNTPLNSVNSGEDSGSLKNRETLFSVNSGGFLTPSKISGVELEPAAWESIDLMPEDLRFIENRLYWIKQDDKPLFLESYRSQWLEAKTAEPRSHCAQNAGRFAANTWLRKRTVKLQLC